MCILLGSLAALRARQGLRPPGLVLGDGRDWLLRGKIETTEYREHSSKRAATPLSPILDAVLAKSIFERISLVGVLASKTF